MSHARQQIREAVATAVTGLGLTGSRVHDSRVHPLEADGLPALLVYSLRERVDDGMDILGDAEFRVLEVTIEAHARAVQGTLDNTLDTICAQVEAALVASIESGASGAVGELVKAAESRLLTTEIVLEAGAEQPTGTATMTWSLLYRVNRADPTTIID